eukprot:14761712-Ditylum_brightwellii.AAC.1
MSQILSSSQATLSWGNTMFALSMKAINLLTNLSTAPCEFALLIERCFWPLLEGFEGAVLLAYMDFVFRCAEDMLLTFCQDGECYKVVASQDTHSKVLRLEAFFGKAD